MTSDAGAAALAAEEAAKAAELAADIAAVAAADPQPDPDKIVAAEVDLARIEAQTEEAKIAARTAVKIAELQQEEPAWLGELRDCLSRIEAGMMVLIERQTAEPLIPQPSPATVIVTEPEAPVIAEPGAVETEGGNVEATTVQPEAIEPAPAANQSTRKRSRWI